MGLEPVKKVHGYKHLYRRGKGDMLYFRRSVPVYARSAFDGKSEVVTSLETSNILEARYRLIEHVTIFDGKLSKAKLLGTAGLDDGHKHVPSSHEIEAEVRVHFAERRRRSNVDRFRVRGMQDEAARHIESLEAFELDSRRQGSVTAEGATQIADWTAEAIVERCGWDLDRNSAQYGKLLGLIHRSQAEASRQEAAEMRNEPAQTLDETFSAAKYEADQRWRKEQVATTPIRLLEVFDAYVAERQPSLRTSRAWRRHLSHLIQFLGHDDAKKIEQRDGIRWKDHLALECQLSPATINDAYLAALKTTLNYGVQNSLLAENVVSKVRVREQPKLRTRERGLNDNEALMILRATMAQSPPKLTPERAFARRWVPWLCAFSGARVNEITQMRAEDIRRVDGFLTMLITPDAGSVKNYQSRQVPIHPQILDLGFEKALVGKTGPLFFDPRRRQKPTPENTQAIKTGEHLAQWVRSIGVMDKRVQPNHGWRHRFKTIARRVQMDPEVRDVIQGHKPRTEGEAYGDTDIEVLFRAICLLPRFEVNIAY